MGYNYKELTITDLTRLAETGDAQAQFYLAYKYRFGDGVHDKEALYWFEKSAERGDVNGQYFTGKCYFNGEGVSRNYETAVEWFEKAAKQGHPEAQHFYGFCFYFGNGVPKDLDKACYWFEKAAKQGNKKAQDLLSSIKAENNRRTNLENTPKSTGYFTRCRSCLHQITISSFPAHCPNCGIHLNGTSGGWAG